MEHWVDFMLREPQSYQPSKNIFSFPKNTFLSMVYFTIAYAVLLVLIHNVWMVQCSFCHYVISMILLICNGKILDLSVTHVTKVPKWRRLCTLLLCLSVALLPTSIYYEQMEHWFKISIFVGSGVLLVITVVLHVAIVEFSELKANSVTQPKYIGSTMYYNILNIFPFCGTFTFALIGDPWSLWWDTLICTDMLLIAVCMSKASKLISVPHRQAEFRKWMRAASLGMATVPALVLLYLDTILQDSLTRNHSRICNGILVLLVASFHIFNFEMEMVKEEGESVKKS